MAVPALTHVAFNCANVDAMVDFYRDYAGMRLVHERNDGGVKVAWVGYEPDDPSFVLVFIGQPGNQPDFPPAAEHLGFACETRAEVDAVADKAEAAGVPVVQGPVELPPPVGYFVIIADPEGNRVEFSYGQPINPRHL